MEIVTTNKGLFVPLLFTLLFIEPVVVKIPVSAQNAIVTENARTGSPASQWDISGAGDLSIQGFATDISVNRGDTVHFKIKTDASAYTIAIYRLGYYQGNGARKVGNGHITATLPQAQPDPLYNASTGLTDCGNWAESAYWLVPASAVSGVYIAKLTRINNGGASHIVFIVRNDVSTSPLLFQTSDATWQAYNVYGGNSLYTGSTSYPSGHAVKVSYNRPFLTRNGGGGGGASEDWLFNAEYPMIRFLERNGYNVSYTTDVDADRRGNLILNHEVYMSVGHDEYWSGGQRTNVEAARNAGVHLAFFSGNEIYWKTRYEASTDGTNTPYRTLVCYKEGTLGENTCGTKCDPLANTWTGLWRDGCSFPSADGCRPENALSGQISWDGTESAIQVPDTYKNLRFWRNTSIASLGSGQTATFPDGTLGYEWDWEQYPASYPAGRIRMSGTTLNGHVHHLSLYRASSGAMVFGAGTVQWSWGLDDKHDRGSAAADVRMQQATVNLFADMGVQPGSLQSGLVAAIASTDQQAPSSLITSPANGGSVPSGSSTTITGTAADAGGGVVAGVEVSTDGGSTWHVANGTTNWSYTWTPSTTGAVTIKSRAVDDNVNLETPGSAPASNAITVNVTASQVTCPCTLFQPNDVPDITATNDNTAQVGIENGVKFYSTQNGFITGIRFYKGSANTGTHTGQLFSLTGTLLAQGTFTNESTSGWQQVTFSNAVAVTAGTVYVAAVHSSAGYYAYTDEYFTTEKVNGPLHALADTDANGPNGVYSYTTNPSFPVSGFQASNYWVDVVFTPNTGPDKTPPTVISTTPVGNAQGISINTSVTATFSEAINLSTVNDTTFKITKATGGKALAATVTYDAANHRIILTPSVPLAYSTAYTVTVKGGTSGKRIKDLAGNYLAANYVWSFTTAAAPIAAAGPDGPVLVITNTANPFSSYTREILNAQGLNEYKAINVGSVNATLLNKYDVVIVGNITLTAAKITLLSDWVNAGGTLIAFRPDAKLAGLLGLTRVSGSLSDKYILVNTASGPGVGIVNQTIQYHGTADLYTLNGASSIATLYSNANTATPNPAITINSVGSNGGTAIAFSYDLARSIVYTRQGNPAWSGQKRDGQIDPIRSDDQFFPNWIDFNKVAIPQADEQMQLLTNIILLNNFHRKPLPRFWFLPRGLKAAVVMTGDDHGNGGTPGRFTEYKQLGPNDPQSVANWSAVRSTSYVYPGTPITDAQAAAFQADGFEIAMHTTTNCENYTPASLEDDYATQLSQFEEQFPSLDSPRTNRTHCIAWSDWASEPKTELSHHIRLDANYYYWPDSWIQDRPGMFTGSGMPMRFADLDGSTIDCYQVTTQMTDESGITYSKFINQLLDKALGSEGYYGVFCANMHTDNASSVGSDTIVASALAHGVPVISSKQMLDWLDGRNGSSFKSITWNGSILNFTVAVGLGGNNLQAMLPVNVGSAHLQSISLKGTAVNFTTQSIKGIAYAFFNAISGAYTATYTESNQPLVAKADTVEQAARTNTDDLYLSVSPNPATDEFTLNVKSFAEAVYNIRVIDLYGKVVYQDKGLGDKTFHFGKTFNTGMYIIQILEADKIKSLKVIKSH